MTESNIDSTTDSDCTGFDRRDTGCGRQCACQTRSAGAVQWNRDYGQRSKPCAGAVGATKHDSRANREQCRSKPSTTDGDCAGPDRRDTGCG